MEHSVGRQSTRSSSIKHSVGRQSVCSIGDSTLSADIVLPRLDIDEEHELLRMCMKDGSFLSRISEFENFLVPHLTFLTRIIMNYPRIFHELLFICISVF